MIARAHPHTYINKTNIMKHTHMIPRAHPHNNARILTHSANKDPPPPPTHTHTSFCLSPFPLQSYAPVYVCVCARTRAWVCVRPCVSVHARVRVCVYVCVVYEECCVIIIFEVLHVYFCWACKVRCAHSCHWDTAPRKWPLIVINII